MSKFNNFLESMMDKNDKVNDFIEQYEYIELSYNNRGLAKRLNAKFDFKVKKWYVKKEWVETYNLIYTSQNNKQELYNKLKSMNDEYNLKQDECFEKHEELYKHLTFNEIKKKYHKLHPTNREEDYKFSMINTEIHNLETDLNIKVDEDEDEDNNF